MQEKLPIYLREELVERAVSFFGVEKTEINYSEFIENILLYFMKPQLNSLKNNDVFTKRIDELTTEPKINIDTIEKNYHFDLSSVEGKWPSDEPVELLLNMLNK